jgi:hypothetical protein
MCKNIFSTAPLCVQAYRNGECRSCLLLGGPSAKSNSNTCAITIGNLGPTNFIALAKLTNEF